MEKKGSGFGGFMLTFLVSLVYHSGWLFAAIAALIVCLIIPYDIWPMYIGLGIWVLSSLMGALIIFVGNKNQDGYTVKQENVNPYSKSNEDFPAINKD